MFIELLFEKNTINLTFFQQRVGEDSGGMLELMGGINSEEDMKLVER